MIRDKVGEAERGRQSVAPLLGSDQKRRKLNRMKARRHESRQTTAGTLCLNWSLIWWNIFLKIYLKLSNYVGDQTSCHFLAEEPLWFSPEVSGLHYWKRKKTLASGLYENRWYLIWFDLSFYIVFWYMQQITMFMFPSVALSTSAWVWLPENTHSSWKVSHYAKFIVVSKQWCFHVACQWTLVCAASMSELF